ncbi:MAG: hypothetical protein ACYC3X_10750 [Pirellulaceae bacterium]
MKKQEVLTMLDRFSDDVNPEVLIDELYLKAKLEKAERAIIQGVVTGQDEVVRRSQEWSK